MEIEPGSAARIAIVAPLTLAGKELRRVLAGSALSIADVALLDGPEQAGTLSDYDGEATLVQVVSEETLSLADVVVFCGAPERVLDWAKPLADRGRVVVDLTGALAGLPEPERGRLVVSGVNDPAIGRGHIFRNPHPATVVVASLLKALIEGAPVLRAEAVVLVPVAEAGEKGIDELYEQTRELLSFRPPPTAVLGERIAFNVLPLEGPGLEARIRDEVAEALAGEAPSLGLSVLRAPLFFGIGVELRLELEREEDRDLIPELLESAANVILLERPGSPGDLPDGGGKEAIHVHVTPGSEPGRVRLWAVADALRRGTVANVVELLERRLG